MPAFSEPYRRRLLEALDALLEQEDDVVPAFLANLEREQGAPFRQRVEQLLASAESSPLLAQPGLPWLQEADLTGMVLGKRYRLQHLLGRGSFGSVWQGDILDLAPKSVAIKIPHSTLRNHISEEALEAEIQSLAHLSHPLIASILDRGAMADGTPYFVMQYIPGESLRKQISGTPWKPHRVCRLIANLAEALAYAHQRGVSHLDIKPENILVRNAGEAFETPFLVDFGISGIQRLLASGRQGEAWSGSALYGAPEYRRGDYQPYGDVYALAVVALELFLGGGLHTPNRTATPLAHRIPAELDASIRIALQSALSPDPTERPADAQAFLKALAGSAQDAANFFVQHTRRRTLLSAEVLNNMVQTAQNSPSFEGDIEQMTQVRQEFAEILERNAHFLEASEDQNEQSSGRLHLVNEIKSVRTLSGTLQVGRFKLAVVGDMKRGKSTILNVLLGADYLPVAVSRCTAVLTVVRYGAPERVVIHYTPDSGLPMEEITTAQFKQRFTLKPEMQRELEAQGRHAFPEVEYAVIETPNALLAKGLEIIDTPGLNDTPALNQLTLEFARDCNAILFVLNPQTLVTMQEKQYFESHFEGRGLPVFFLVNRWDQVSAQLMDSDDPEAVREAEEEIRRQIRSSVEPLLQGGDGGPLAERIHELSALQARKRLAQDPEASLDGTGFDLFYAVLSRFLKEGRLRSEMRTARILTSNTYRELHRKITDRIGMMGTTPSVFAERYEAVKPIFDDLRKIRDRVKVEFEQAEKQEPRLIAASLNLFLRGLAPEIRRDFADYMPDLNSWQTFRLLTAQEQEKFAMQLRDAFSRFLQHKLPRWEQEAGRMLERSIDRLHTVTEGYAIDYAVNMDIISQRLSGGSLIAKPDITADDSPWWTRAVAGGAAFILGDPLGAGMAAHKLFNWRDVGKNIAVVLTTQILLYIVTGGVLGPIGVLIAGMAAGIWNARGAVERLKDRIAETLADDLPLLASQAEEEAVRHIREIYRSARERVLESIEADLESRQAEIDNLQEYMRLHEIDNEQERIRLLDQDAAQLSLVQAIEVAEDRWLKALS